MAGPLEKVIQNNTKRLEGLLDKARQIDSGDYSELEKDQARFFVARQTCRLLKVCAPIKDRIPDYDTLVEIFCGTALEVLSGSEE
ncbi:MAG: hypothetical protein KIT14_12190 [bacterium]|nr:hypothetical protein [bacterium]